MLSDCSSSFLCTRQRHDVLCAFEIVDYDEAFANFCSPVTLKMITYQCVFKVDFCEVSIGKVGPRDDGVLQNCT